MLPHRQQKGVLPSYSLQPGIKLRREHIYMSHVFWSDWAKRKKEKPQCHYLQIMTFGELTLNESFAFQLSTPFPSMGNTHINADAIPGCLTNQSEFLFYLVIIKKLDNCLQ